MSPIAVGGPELQIGTAEAYVALMRPQIDPTQPGVLAAARDAGVSPEEFAGPGDVWALMYDVDGEGDGFELPGARDVEADAFAEQLQQALSAAGPFTVEAGNFLRLEARPSGGDWVVTAQITPPEEEDGATAARTLELGALPAAELLAELEQFRRELA
ncbi:hypothetical protein DEJ51_19175 [Streptomyces venezuelae]|uniref:Uncharacterized protein n=1 Tax=Streptomyces venezuelae TaxID=54571 RepID=A0A5P2DRX1_STRVZ|nr:hypothetical protein [Streptomyces venezuelae]QES56021.1 hypothetical protein DEJ51_19175 [Streptomyces venezuelae]